MLLSIIYIYIYMSANIAAEFAEMTYYVEHSHVDTCTSFMTGPPEQMYDCLCHHPQKLPGPVLLSKPSFPVMRRASQAKAGKAFRPDTQSAQYFNICNLPN